MKKPLTVAFFMLLGSTLWASLPHPTPEYPFQDDLYCLDDEFAGITQLECLVETRNATYTQLASENNPLLGYVTSENKDISESLLGAGGKMDETLKIILIVFGVLAVLAIGCCLALVIWGNSWYWY